MGVGNVISLAGIFVLLFTAWAMSENRRVVNRQVIVGGLALQLLFGVFIFVFPLGRQLFEQLNNAVFGLLSYSNQGTAFLFGNLAIGPGQKGSMGLFVAFQILPAVIFFAALIGLLYHFGIMQFFIRIFARLFARLLNVSGAEALCVSSNIFVGVESGLTIRPYIHLMTRSELFVILAAGMATIASTVLAINAGFLRSTFPTIAGHLISASLLSAPAVLMIAKLMVPETGHPETMGSSVKGEFEKPDNWVESIIKNSMEGVRLAVGIGAMLLVFVSFLGMFNGILGWCGVHVGMPGLTLQKILGYAFYPFVVAIGVPLADAGHVSSLLGLRVVLTEVPCYSILAQWTQSGVFQSPRSVVIASYCLCGFAHIPAVAIFVGGFAAIEPRRAKDLGKLGFRAMLAATLACLMTGAIAGVFYTGNERLVLKQAAPKASQAPGKAPKARATKKAASVKATSSGKTISAARKATPARAAAKRASAARVTPKTAPRSAASVDRTAPVVRRGEGVAPSNRVPPKKR